MPTMPDKLPEIPLIAEASQFPVRRLPQADYDSTVKAAMDSLNAMTTSLNGPWREAVNAWRGVGDFIHENRNIIADAPAQARAAQLAASNAAISERNARIYAENARAVAGVQIGSTTAAGLLKPDGVTIVADDEGTISTVGAENLKKYDVVEKAVDMGDVSGTVVIDLSAGRSFRLAVAGATTINVPSSASLRGVCFLMSIENGGRHAVTWGMSPAWSDGVAPDLTPVGTDLVAMTLDAWGKMYGVHVGRNMW